MKTLRKKLWNAIRKYKLVLDYEKWCQYKTKEKFESELVKAENRIKNVFKKPRLHVKQTSISELTQKWQIRPASFLRWEDIYIRCTAQGVVNWDTSNVYKAKELIERDNVKIL